MSKKFEGKMPNGVVTTDADAYAIAWTALFEPFRVLGYTSVGFDPSIGITKGGRTFSIPVDIAEEFIELTLLKADVAKLIGSS